MATLVGAYGADQGEEKTHAARLTVVVADDSWAVLGLMTEILKGAVDEVITASDGEDAWRAIRTHRPRVAVLDAQMPGLTGLQVAALVSADPDLTETRVVLVTGDMTSEVKAATGISRLLEKPFRPYELVGAVRELAGQ